MLRLRGGVTTLRMSVGVLGLAALLALAYALAARSFSSLPDAIDTDQAYTGLGQHPVSVVSHGWHTGFVVPSTALFARLPRLEERFGATTSIEIGWGDQGFYQAREITSGLTLQALFWPDGSVLHAVGLDLSPREHFPLSHIKSFCLTDGELDRLLDYIAGSFHKDPNGDPLEMQPGIYGNSQFYRGKGDFHLMNTCNKWTAKGLRSIGMPITTTFKLTADSVMRYLDDQVVSSAADCPAAGTDRDAAQPVPE